jgi:hypothetical protein
MKFEEMKKIWDEQNQEHLYVIDEKRLHDNIKVRKQKGSKLINRMEWFLIAVNFLTGTFLLTTVIIEKESDLFINTLVVVMLGAALFIYSRHRARLKNENRFDRSMLGDLDHAIANATYQARLSYSMLIYFVLVWILVFLSAINSQSSMKMMIFLGVMFVVFLFLGSWEHKAWHLGRKKRLESMRAKLVE